MGVHLSPRYGQVILVCGYPVLTAVNRPSHRYGGHIELIRFKEYYGMFRGHPLPAKIELHCIFLGKKAMIITSKQGTTIFFPITIFF